MSASDTGQKLVRSSALRGLSFAVHAVVTLLMTPLIVHSLGERMYGFWTLVGTFVGYYGIMDMGVSSAVTRYVSRSLGQSDDDEINRVVSTSFFLFAGVAVVVLALTVLVAALAFVVVREPAEYRVVRVLLLVLGVRVALSFPARVFAGLLNAHLRHDLTAAATIAQLLVGNAAIYLHLRGDGGVIGMSLLVLAAAAMEYLLNLVSALRVFPRLRLSRALAQRQVLTAIFHYSWRTLGAQAAGILRSKVSGFIVAAFLGVNLVTYFSIATRLIGYFTELVFSLVGNLAPVFSRYEGEGKPELIRSRFVLFTKLSVILTVFVGASIIFYGAAFIERWMGAGFEQSYWVVAILAVPTTLSLMQTPASCLLYGISKHQYVALLGGVESVLNLGAGLALAPVLGIYGVAVGTSMGPIVTSVILYPIVVSRQVGLSLSQYYLRVLLLPSLESLAVLSVFFVACHGLLRSRFGTIAVLGSIQALVYFPIAGLIVLSADERGILISSLLRKLRRAAPSGAGRQPCHRG